MKIEGVVISCYRFDLALTRVCVASIRFWYPHVPIWLLKDRHYGDFNTREIERNWNVQVYAGRQKTLGWGFGKLEVMTELPARRLLLLDSDIVFAGRVIDRLEQFDEDLIVHKEDYDATAVEKQFFPPGKLRQLDPAFIFPGFGFNGGQIVATTGRLSRNDFDGLLNWETKRVKIADIFQMGDQGITNYVVLRKVQKSELTLRREPFMIWPGNETATCQIRLADLTREGRHQELIHWAGLRWGKTLEQMPRSDILLHFEKLYYRRIPFGSWLQLSRRVKPRLSIAFVAPWKRMAKRVLRGERPVPAAE